MARMSNLPVPFTFKMLVTAAGTPERLGPKLRSTGIAFVEAGENANDTITDTGNNFLKSGFEPGDQLIVTGTSGGTNDGTYQIKSVVAGTITLAGRNDVTAEAAGATINLRANKTVPDGIRVVVKGKTGNTGQIYVADTSVKAAAGVGAFELDAVESVKLQLNELQQLWVDAGTSADGVEVIYESNTAAAA